MLPPDARSSRRRGGGLGGPRPSPPWPTPLPAADEWPQFRATPGSRGRRALAGAAPRPCCGPTTPAGRASSRPPRSWAGGCTSAPGGQAPRPRPRQRAPGSGRTRRGGDRRVLSLRRGRGRSTSATSRRPARGRRRGRPAPGRSRPAPRSAPRRSWRGASSSSARTTAGCTPSTRRRERSGGASRPTGRCTPRARSTPASCTWRAATRSCGRCGRRRGRPSRSPSGATPAPRPRSGRRAYYGTFEDEVLASTSARGRSSGATGTPAAVPLLLLGRAGRGAGGPRGPRPTRARARRGHREGRVDLRHARPGRLVPAIAGGQVFVGSGDGRLYALDLQTGALVASFEAGAGITASPAIAGGRLVVGAVDGQVYCFGRRS
jgi:hypothetical protein